MGAPGETGDKIQAGNKGTRGLASVDLKYLSGRWRSPAGNPSVLYAVRDILRIRPPNGSKWGDHWNLRNHGALYWFIQLYRILRRYGPLLRLKPIVV